ncbi:MAG: ABC transporter ATP-binding protein/permease [Bacilli bacterium]|nr:ABC transporter ATP-binding protein/permease [Bacilli bacterium]
MSPAPHGGRRPHEKISRQDMGKSLKQIAIKAKRFSAPIFIAAAFVLGTVILAVIAPQYLSTMTNEITDHAATQTIDLDKVANLGFILAAIYVSSAIMSYVAAFLLTGVTQRFANIMRREIAEKIDRMPLSYFDSHQIGDIMSRVTNDVDSVAQGLDTVISMIARAVFLLIGSLIGMFVTAWQMALTALITIPLIVIFLGVNMRLAMPQFIKRQSKLGQVNGIVEEKYSGQLIVNLFNAQEREDARFDEANVDLGKTMFKAQFFGGLMMPMMNFISYFAYVSVLVVGGVLIANEVPGISFGTITAFTVYVRLFQQPLTEVAQALNSLQTISAAGKRVFDFMDQPDVEDDSRVERKLLVNGNSIKGEVEFRHVNFSYDESREIIHDFSAKVKPGSKVAIVGPTGAGKTTMVNLLMRFYEVNSGDILIDGVSIKDMPRSEIRDIFGMVLQDTWVFEGTMRENVNYNSEPLSTEDLKAVCKKANLYHFVRTLPGKLDATITDANSISAGQKQLITIARAMVRKAPMMILDEATSNVDTRTEELIQEAMDELTSGKTSFVIAHRLSTIRNADLILVMKDGNIIEQGNHEELMAQNGFYAGLYNSQFSFQ